MGMDAGSGTAFTFNNGKGHSALAGVSSLLISEVSSCGAVTSLAAETTGDDAALPVSRTLTGVTESGAASTATISGIATSNTDSSKCSYSLQRYVITLDSMPTSSAAGNNAVAYKKLLYKSPVGSCNVAETTKGTFESYECSNRGACDGKSGLCACYAGYSGESCQTQNVLVQRRTFFYCLDSKIHNVVLAAYVPTQKTLFHATLANCEVCPLLYNHKYHQ